MLVDKHTITLLNIARTDLIWPDNVDKWGDTLMVNKTFSALCLDPFELMVIKEGAEDYTTMKRTIEIINILPRSCQKVKIYYSKLGREFMEAVIRFVKGSTRVTELELSSCCLKELRAAQQLGERLAYALADNQTITSLNIARTNLIGENNVRRWGNALTKNKTITTLCMDGAEANALMEATEERTPKLTVSC